MIYFFKRIWDKINKTDSLVILIYWSWLYYAIILALILCAVINYYT